MRVAIAALVLAACAPESPTYQCVFWSQCGDGGVCEPTQWCSFEDVSCPNGRRYGPFADDLHADQCVDFDPRWSGMCDLAHPCDGDMKCREGRCNAVESLSASARLAGAQCSYAFSDSGGDAWIWGTLDAISPNLGLVPSNITHPDFLAQPSTAITVGADHVCTVGDGFSHCLGSDTYKQRGLEPGPDIRYKPTPILSLVLGAGPIHTCGVAAADGTVQCWGDDTYGQLDGTPGPPIATPQIVAELDPMPIVKIASGTQFTCAASVGEISCWGSGGWPVGTLTTSDGSPGFVTGFRGGPIVDLEAGQQHACAIKGAAIWCWGTNSVGQVTGVAGGAALPTSPLSLPSISVAAGAGHSCAVTTNGEIWCWGDGTANQLDGQVGPAPVRVLADAPRAVGPIAAGDNFTCAAFHDGFIRCWGTSEVVRPNETDLFPVCHLPSS
jgi:alpha-tubulin suppressor-like RCC1 family protein